MHLATRITLTAPVATSAPDVDGRRLIASGCENHTAASPRSTKRYPVADTVRVDRHERRMRETL